MKMNTLKKTIGGVTLGAALLFVPVKKATAAELTTNLGTNPNHPARVMPESATLETEAVSVLDSEASLEGGDPNPCPLLTKLNISGMTSEEVAAINKVWEMQPERFRPYIEKFFMDNIGKFKGMEKERVICLMNELYWELTEEELTYANGKRFDLEAKRGLTPEQREQISESEKHFIDGGIIYAQNERQKSEAATAESRAAIAESKTRTLQRVTNVYVAYTQKPNEQGLNTLVAMKKELAGRDPSLTKDIFEKIDKEVEKNRNRVK